MVIKKIILSILIIFILNSFVKSDITDSDEINTLWWLGTQYNLKWDLSSSICGNNIGITCNSAKTHVIKLVIDQNIPQGAIIGPNGAITGDSSSSSSTSSGSSGDSTSSISTSGSGTTYTTTDSYTTSMPSSSSGTYTTTDSYTTSMPSSSSGSGSGTTYTSTNSYTSSMPSSGSSGSGSGTTYTSTNSYTTVSPNSQEINNPVFTLEFEDKGRSLLSTVRGVPNQISSLYLPQLQSLVISISISTSYNILEYIGNLDITYLEINNAQELDIWPSTPYLYNLPKLNTIKLKGLSSTTIPDEFFKKGMPIVTLVIDFPVSYFPWVIPGQAFGIQNLNLYYNGGSIVDIDGYTWQYLENLQIKTSKGLKFGNFSTLTNIEIECIDNTNNINFEFDSNVEMSSNIFKDCRLENLYYYDSNLTSLSIFDSSISGTINSFSLPESLQVLEMERSYSYFLPSVYQLPNLKQLLIPFNSFSTGLAKFDKLNKINATTSHIPGNVPAEFCTISSIELSNNNFLSVPDCFLCHWSVTSVWFTGNSNSLYPNGYQCTTASVSSSSFEVLSVGETIEFSGEDLGWALPGSDSSLHVLVPNKQFKYDFPPKSQGITQKMISFSNEVKFNFQWTYYDLTIGSVVYTQNPEYLHVDIIGSFDSSSRIYLNNVQYTPVSRNRTVIQLVLEKSFQEGKVVVKVQSSLISVSFDSIYKRSFPIINSASIVPKTGGQATIYGSFYYLDKNQTPTIPVIPIISYTSGGRSLLQITEDEQELKVYVNGIECQIIFSNSTVVIFSAPTLNKSGYANILVENVNYNFTSTKVLYYEILDNECSKVCENDGVCVSGSCKCVGEFSGPTCSFKKPPLNSFTLKASENEPSATYSFEKVDFEFSLRSVQEISAFGQVVKEINTTEWKPQSIQLQPFGSVNMYSSTQTTGDISIQVIVAVVQKSLPYEFAGVSMDLEPNQVKVLMNISNWDYQSSLNTLRAVFISTSKSTTDNKCESNDQEAESLADGAGLLSFSIKRSGAVLLGQFINRMISNDVVTFSQVEDLGVDEFGISYAAINMPQCKQCILDPNYSSLLDTNFSSKNKCGNSRAWVIPVAVVIPIVALSAIGVVGYIYLKKRFYLSRDGHSIKLTRRGNSKRGSKYGLDSFK